MLIMFDCIIVIVVENEIIFSIVIMFVINDISLVLNEAAGYRASCYMRALAV